MGSELAKAYVQIIPSARGMQGSLEKELGDGMPAAGAAAGNKFGAGLVGKIKSIIGIAAIGKGLAETIKAGGALEQSIGGIETLFGASADAVIKNAQQAYETVGLSANDYMEQATSFAASLNQSLGGDTVAAAAAADTALRDMADNSNKMGTDMERITDAYQGFAKQNYTMLDNLKLGYGGTKTEMQRLIQDANTVKAANGEMADLSIDSFADVVEAIHTMQNEMGITGTTALEASETLIGSGKAMKAAFKDVLGNLALGKNIGPSLNALAVTVKTFLIGNLAPAVLNVITALPGAALTFLKALIPGNMAELVSNIATGFSTFMTQQLPAIISNGVATISSFISGFLSGLPSFISSIGALLNTFTASIATALPSFIAGGMQLLLSLVTGIVQNLPDIISAAASVISGFITTIVSHLPELLAQGIAMIGQLVAGLISMLPDVIAGAANIISNICDAFGSVDWGELGINIIRGIVTGIKNAAVALFNAVKELASNALNAAKDALGINSPSRVFANEVGRYIPAGTAVGIKKNSNLVTEAVNDMSKFSVGKFRTALSYQTSIGAGAYQTGGITVIQHIHSEARSAAELMAEARYQQEMAVMLGA